MPVKKDFFRPSGHDGRAARKAAAFWARPENQKTYADEIESMRAHTNSSSDAVAWQLAHGDERLKKHAAKEVSSAMHRYAAGGKDPSGTFGGMLARICGILNIDLGSLLKHRDDPARIIHTVYRHTLTQEHKLTIRPKRTPEVRVRRIRGSKKSWW